MLSVNEAIIRFGMDKNEDKSQVFSIGLSTLLTGFALFCLLVPLMLRIRILSSYTLLIYLYVFAASLKGVTAQFVRSVGLIKLYAFDGFLSTVTTIVLNVVFLVSFSWGATGYVLSIILSNLISVIFLFAIANLKQFVCLRGIDKKLRRAMLRYSIPLIPTTMFWWITMASDRYFVTWYHGEGANGLYAAAHKLPAVLTLVSLVFYQAWQISAISEAGGGIKTSRFYNRIYEYYSSLLFLAASGIILVCRPFTAIWLSQDFYDSWRYVPFLTTAEVFSTLITFLGSFYMVTKRNATVPLAIAVGAGINIGLNYLFVPTYGALGAAGATVVSYSIAFLCRGVDVRRVVKIRLRPVRSALSLLLLLLQSALLLSEVGPGFLLTQLIFFLLMLLLHLRSVLRMLMSLLGRQLSKTPSPFKGKSHVSHKAPDNPSSDDEASFNSPIKDSSTDRPIDSSDLQEDLQSIDWTDDFPTASSSSTTVDAPPFGPDPPWSFDFNNDASVDEKSDTAIDFDSLPQWTPAFQHNRQPDWANLGEEQLPSFTVDAWNQPYEAERIPSLQKEPHARLKAMINGRPVTKTLSDIQKSPPSATQSELPSSALPDDEADLIQPEDLRRRFLDEENSIDGNAEQEEP
jgi:O-antigen/teichoic acid export membrane protein